MPHVSNENDHRKLIKQDPKTHVKDWGDLNYYITVTHIIPRWKETPRYATVHEILAYKEAIVMKTLSVLFHHSKFHIEKAFDLAWTQFYAEVVLPYEAKKARQNGNVFLEEGCFQDIVGPVATAEAYPVWDGESQGE